MCRSSVCARASWRVCDADGPTPRQSTLSRHLVDTDHRPDTDTPTTEVLLAFHRTDLRDHASQTSTRPSSPARATIAPRPPLGSRSPPRRPGMARMPPRRRGRKHRVVDLPLSNLHSRLSIQLSSRSDPAQTSVLSSHATGGAMHLPTYMGARTWGARTRALQPTRSSSENFF